MAIALTNGAVHHQPPGTAVVVDAGRIRAIVPECELPDAIERYDMHGLTLAPGFIDTQVNGGGGVLFNAEPTVRTIATISRAHRRFGTTGFLPTLITDTPDKMDRAMRAVEEAIADGMRDVLGIHLEGPLLNQAYRGVHDAGKFLRIDDAMVERVCSLRGGVTLLTIAPELMPLEVITELSRRGVILAAGHTGADYDQMRAALDAGIRGFTHLFNAMSPLASRAPGAVGAAIENQSAWAGIIVDGVHVHPATLRIAMAARPHDRFMLVTDAMSTVGTDATEFELDGRQIDVRAGSCWTAEGVLAGSALTMADAVANAERFLNIAQDEAIDMASAAPADFLGIGHERGRIEIGCRADFVFLDDERRPVMTWLAEDHVPGGRLAR